MLRPPQMFLFAATAFLCSAGVAQPPRKAFHPEQVKAVFLVNFCRFATWPEQAFANPASPIIIGVWSDSNFAELAQEAAKGERVGSRAIDVRTINAPNEVESVNLLYVPVKAETHFEQWQKEAKKEILLVGDSPAFLRSGGHIQFVQEAARIKLKVNLDALKSGRVMLNSTLLRIADTSPLP